jgi:ABC-type nitrate/sulfonate/bicarbonate transport system substrate-binding protein
MRSIRRLSVALAALLLSASLVQAGDTAPVRVRFGVLTTGSQAAFIVGVKQGIFAKRGFDAEVLPLATGAQANQALAANQVDWSGGGIESTVVAWATGLPFKAYAMYAKGGDSYGILVRNDANIHSPADLAGKKVAVPQGTAPAQGLSQVMKHAGLAPDAVKRVNATYSNMGQMLVQGAVDAMVGLEPFLTLTNEVMAGKATLLMRLGKEVQGGGFFLITDAWAKAHPDKIEDAVAGLWESQQWVRQHQPEAAKIAAEFLKVEPRLVEAAFKTLEYNPTVDDFTRTSIKNTSEYLASEGLIPKAVDPVEHLKALDQVTTTLQAKSPELLK